MRPPLRLGRLENGIEETVESRGWFAFLFSEASDDSAAVLDDLLEAMRQPDTLVKLHVDESGVLFLNVLQKNRKRKYLP